MNQYETMFLLDAAFAADFQHAKAEVERILQRAGAQVIFLEKWDERRLAYEIKGCKRGCYVLSYYQCDPDKIAQIERDCALSEPILRILVKQAEGVTREQMESYLPARRDEDASPRSEGGASRRDSGDENRDEGQAEKPEAPKSEAKPSGDAAESPSGSSETDAASSKSAVAVQAEEPKE